MECILSIVTCLCGRLSDGLGGTVQAQAESGFSSLLSPVRKAILDRIDEWQKKVIPQPTDTTTLVGAEENLKAIRCHLLGNEVDVVGIVGMGGVGKTTLLKKINNDFYSGGAGNFNIVIFVTVSSEGDVLKVQKVIAKRLGLPEPTYSGAISDALKGKRYLLLLDDVWGELDLSAIGVPFPNSQNKCKIAVTTRSSDIFGNFFGERCRPRGRARVVDVRKLDESRSWELFRSVVDPTVDLDDTSIALHAEKMVQKCDGLPLALVTVGKTMARATLAAEWREAEKQWEESPYHLRGMDQVKSNLMFSIDRLKEQGTLLPCFLYCSLFPEDYDILEEQLIEYWIGEGFLDGGDKAPPHRRGDEGVYGSLDSTRDKGKIAIKKLKDLCLLESGTRRGCVKMHDLVREVALVLAKLEPNRFVVHAFNFSLPESRPIISVDAGWEEATGVSLMYCKIQEGSLPEMPCWRRMSTLLMNVVVDDLSGYLSDGFFTYMSNLVVLDLSSSLGRTVPTSICLLSELRFLSLRYTGIRSLPKELGNLVKLRQLDLSWTSKLEEIPQQAILRLSNLQVLNMMRCGYEWGGENNVDATGNNGDIQLSFSDLDGMYQLKDFRIRIYQLLVLESLFNLRDSLLTSIKELNLSCVYGLTTNILQSALQSMTSLRRLHIVFCALTGELTLYGPMLSELEELELWEVDLSAILIRRDGINEEGGDNSGYKRPQRHWRGPLQKLKRLKLGDLPNLQRICYDPPQECLPSLEYLQVDDCPLLRTLPLGPHSKIKEILCEQKWWKKLQWRRDQGISYYM